MADYDLALGIKTPQIDVATPLLAAAKIRAADQQAQLNQMEIRKEAIGQMARGIAPYADTPQFAEMWAKGHDSLASQGIFNHLDPATYQDLRNSPSKLGLQSLLQQAAKPELLFHQEEAKRAQSNADRAFELQQAQFEEAKRQHAEAENKPVPVSPGASLINPKSGATVATNEDISDEDAKATAERYVDTGNRMVLSAVGLRGTARNRVQHFVKQVMDEKGISTQEMGNREAEWEGRKSGQRVLGTQEAKMGSAAFEAEGAIKLARPIVDKVPRTSILPFNQLIQGYQKQTLDPDQAELFTRLQAIVNTYSAVMSRGANVTTDASRHRAEDLLNSAADAKTLHRVMNTMQQEIDMAKNSPERMRKFYSEKYGAKTVEGGATDAPAPAPAPASDPLGIR